MTSRRPIKEYNAPHQRPGHERSEWPGPTACDCYASLSLSSNCCAVPPIWSQGAFEPTNMCFSISISGSPSTVPNVMPITLPLKKPHKVDPQTLQNPSPQSFSDSYRWTLSPPSIHLNLLEPPISANAEDALLKALRQREQWHDLASFNGPSISYLTAPQKPPPLIN